MTDLFKIEAFFEYLVFCVLLENLVTGLRPREPPEKIDIDGYLVHNKLSQKVLCYEKTKWTH